MYNVVTCERYAHEQILSLLCSYRIDGLCRKQVVYKPVSTVKYSQCTQKNYSNSATARASRLRVCKNYYVTCI